MKIKNIVLIIILVALTSFIVSCGNGVKAVREIPAGFIQLSSEKNESNNSLSYKFEDDEVAFYDTDGTCVYGIKQHNSDFIVRFGDAYYVNEEKYIEIINTQTASKIVDEIPPGFVSLKTLDVQTSMFFGYGKKQISFSKNGVCFYQTDLSNSDFIVGYNYEYYINYEQYLDLVKKASSEIAAEPEIIGKPVPVKIVQIKPEGFILLDEAIKNQDNGMSFMFFENGFTLFDADWVGIFGTRTDDQEFIVEFEDEIYVNEKKFLEIAKLAEPAVEKQNKIYHIGEEVEIPGRLCIIKIEEVNASTSDITTLYTIKYSIRTDIGKRFINELFDHVETDKGTIIKEFTFIDEGTFQVTVPTGEKINIIVVKGLLNSAIRKIGVNN